MSLTSEPAGLCSFFSMVVSSSCLLCRRLLVPGTPVSARVLSPSIRAGLRSAFIASPPPVKQHDNGSPSLRDRVAGAGAWSHHFITSSPCHRRERASMAQGGMGRFGSLERWGGVHAGREIALRGLEITVLGWGFYVYEERLLRGVDRGRSAGGFIAVRGGRVTGECGAGLQGVLRRSAWVTL